jgi:DNA-binding NtrC family response regulator
MYATRPESLSFVAARDATVWVMNSDSQVRQVVENAVQDYPLYTRVRLIFSEDFRLPVTTSQPDVVLINLTALTDSCFSILSKIHGQWPDAHVIFVSQSDDVYLWTEAIQLGAYEFLPRSVEDHQLGWVLQGALWSNRKTMSIVPALSC